MPVEKACPILPARSLTEIRAFYERVGFATEVGGWTRSGVTRIGSVED
jgi:hypothetical protein